MRCGETGELGMEGRGEGEGVMDRLIESYMEETKRGEGERRGDGMMDNNNNNSEKIITIKIKQCLTTALTINIVII